MQLIAPTDLSTSATERGARSRFHGKRERAMPRASRYTGRNRILAALPPEDFDRFSPALQPIFLSLRQVIHDVSSPIEHVYFVEQGVGSG